jgi:PmbA protein
MVKAPLGRVNRLDWGTLTFEATSCVRVGRTARSHRSKEMLDRESARHLVQRIISMSPADATEAVIVEEDSALTRLAESRIHQNVARGDTELIARVAVGRRYGVASGNQLDPGSIETTLESARLAALHSPESDDFVALPGPQKEIRFDGLVPATVHSQPMDRAKEFAAAVGCSSSGQSLGGMFEVNRRTTTVANSNGVFQFYRDTSAEASLTVESKEGGSGFAQVDSSDVSKISGVRMGSSASERARMTDNPVELPPGEYTVVLEPAAVGQLLLFLSFMGFGARSFLSRRSFMAQGLGQRITGENITVIDDVHNPRMPGLPFDFEGIPRQRVPLIEEGVAKGVVFDSYYGAQAGKKSTGHAQPANNTYGPRPTNMVMSGGKATIDEMIRSTEKGLLISRFWYMNFANPMKTEVTATTREGTMLIEGGRPTRGAKELRILQSILDAFSRAEMIGREQVLYNQFNTYMLVPAMKVEKFKFVA